MNCFNVEVFKRGLKSVIHQTYENWNYFLSTIVQDSSAEIFHSYSDKRLKYFKTEYNMTLGSARQFGLNLVSGDWIAFLDTDDVWYENKLDKQKKHIDKKMYNLLRGYS